MGARLLITYVPELEDGKPIYFSSNCLPFKARYEPAGHSFHSAALKLSGYCEKEESDSDDQQSSSDGKSESSYMPSADGYSSKGKKKSGEGKEQDHYALLGLGHLRYLATEDQIKKSYRETALKYHPDKQASLLLAEKSEAAKEKKKEEIETHFKSIQEAYELLLDPVKRRNYDSTDEFDDEIPTDCSPQDFFKVFGPAFMRNGRWSVTQPIPLLGDEKSPITEVDKFYNFWYSFKSWREFPHSDEFDIEQAESRDHKRWMERQNSKLSEKARKEETTRIRTLVDNAYRRDPRIQKRKEEEKAEKQRKKQAKYLVKRLQEEEAAKAAEEERLRKVEEDKKAAELASQQKKIKEKEKKLLRKEKSRLRTLASPVVSQRLFDISEDSVEGLCTSLVMDQLKDLCDKMDGLEVGEKGKILKKALGFHDDMETEVKVEKKVEKVQPPPPQQNGSVKSNGNAIFGNIEKKEKPWTREEIELLRKGMVKFPKGTSRRWEVVSEYIGTGRSVEDILKATKTVLLQKPDNSKAFDSFLEKRKPAATIASPLSTRDEIGIGITPNNANGPTTEDTEKLQSSKASSSSGNESSSTTPAEESSGSDQDAWSAVQEKALVQALKTFPKETAQRWERVATAVPGKTVNQCKKKFTSLKESFRNKKTTA